MKKIFALLIVATFFRSAYSQEVLLGVDVAADSAKAEKKESKNSTMIYSGLGFTFGKNVKGAETIAGKTNDWRIGIRHSRSLSKTFTFGFDLTYLKRNFRFRQDSSKIFPNTVLHKSEKLTLNDAYGDLFLRIRYGSRKSGKEGKFFDLGGYGAWVFKSVFRTVDEIPGNVPAKQLEMKFTGLDYTEALSYGLLFRAGFNSVVLFGEYRLSPVFTKASGYPELPQITAGLTIGLQ